jgi:hypothetical protein
VQDEKQLISSLGRGIAMRSYSPGRGSKKAVRKFTYRQGIFMATWITGAMIALMLLWIFGILRFDVD